MPSRASVNHSTSAVQHLFESQVRRTPDSRALVDVEHDLTYSALNARVNQLAWHLRTLGVGPEARVAVVAHNLVDAVIASFGILKAGGAYVPLDAAWPDARIAALLEDADAGILVTSAETSVSTYFRGPVVSLRDETQALRAQSIANPDAVVDPGQLFSIVYTSGSTGHPKGVLIPVRSVLNRLSWMWSAYPYRTEDVSLLYRTHAAIGFTWDCFGPLLQGVPVATAPMIDMRDPSELVKTATGHDVSHISASPSRWEAIIEYLERHRIPWHSLRLARSSGEPLRPDLVERWRRLFPAVPLLNIYGGTECSSSTAYHTGALDPRAATRTPVGTAVTNVAVRVLDETFRPVAAGETGDLGVAGACLARGYLRRPGLTAERFVPDPLGSEPGARLFRTGDVACRRPDGAIEIVGRRDQQVKIRGFRVALEEVEAALCHCEGVLEAAAGAHEPTPGDVRLVAYVVIREAAPIDLRSHLREVLPEYMVPSSVVFLDSMPRTASGKIAHRLLPAPADAGAARASTFSAPRTPQEQAIAEIWGDVLRLEKIGLDDHFFELGGHSLLAMQVVNRIYDTFGLELDIQALFEMPTIRALSDSIDVSLAGSFARPNVLTEEP